MVAIATDRVDYRDLEKPAAYNLKSIIWVATIFGILSTIFDGIFFLLFYRAGPIVFRTNWFIASILTELSLIFSLRSRAPFYAAQRPSGILLLLSGLAALITLMIPLSGWGQKFLGFVKPLPKDLVVILFLVLGYFFTNELVKRFYYIYVNHQKA